MCLSCSDTCASLNEIPASCAALSVLATLDSILVNSGESPNNSLRAANFSFVSIFFPPSIVNEVNGLAALFGGVILLSKIEISLNTPSSSG